MKKLIFGYGETGKAVEQYFINNKIDFEIYDDNISDFNRDITDNLMEFDEVIISPGIPPDNLLLSKIKSQNLIISTDLDLFFRYNDKNIKIIGITGTNGKTSFVNIVKEFLEKNGHIYVLIVPSRLRNYDKLLLYLIYLNPINKSNLKKVLIIHLKMACLYFQRMNTQY